MPRGSLVDQGQVYDKWYQSSVSTSRKHTLLIRMSSPHSETTHVIEEALKQPKRGRSRSRDVLEDTNAGLAKVELAMMDGQEKLEVVDQRIDELERESEELP